MIKEVLKNLEKIKMSAAHEMEKVEHIPEEMERVKNKYMGRKGILNQFFKKIGVLDEQERKEIGGMANRVKEELANYFKSLTERHEKKTDNTVIDETIPGNIGRRGTIHPITQFIDKITDIFYSMGFEVVEDREVETAEYNFDKLNIAANHPARDMWDTFYIKLKAQSSKLKTNEGASLEVGQEPSSVVLRTHTSPVQLRAMETRKPPVRLVVPGRCYRHEATDASHETNFYQLEGLVIDEGISVANMIHTVNVVLKGIFGEEVRTRIRPSFFPFVEPGHEVDMSCIICEQKGCSVCGKTGWLEMMGAGMVHPYVLGQMGVGQSKYTGFAFGMGIDRMMMLYYGVDDIRLSYLGDLRFLKQF